MSDCALLPERDPSVTCSKEWFALRLHY
jgi:hypothetical protein